MKNLERTKYDVKEVITHDDWHGNPLDFPDLALIKLAKKVTFRTKSFQTDMIAPACLSNENIQKGVYDSEAFVAGKLLQINLCRFVIFSNLKLASKGPGNRISKF